MLANNATAQYCTFDSVVVWAYALEPGGQPCVPKYREYKMFIALSTSANSIVFSDSIHCFPFGSKSQGNIFLRNNTK